MFINCKFIDFLLECTYFERHAQVCGVTVVWIWPLPIHHVARSKPQRRGPVGMRWKTRDCKDVCCEPDGRTASWVNTAVLPGRVGVRELLLILSQGFLEPYEQLLPDRVYAAYETGTSDQINTICRVCGNVAENLAHVLAGCLSLAQTK